MMGIPNVPECVWEWLGGYTRFEVGTKQDGMDRGGLQGWKNWVG